MESYQLRFEGAVPIPWHFDRQFAELALERLATLVVARIARRIGNRFMLAVTKVVGQFGIQRFLGQQLGQLLEQAILGNQVFGFLVIRQQAG